ncbi:MAG TPA: outer membrane beta-barrel protein [Verrucomicrobiae bacterium]
MKKQPARTSLRNKQQRLLTAGAFLGVIAGGSFAAHAQMTTPPDAEAFAKLEKQNQELKERLDALEDVAKKEGLLPSGTSAPKYVSALGDMTISGFVQTSYFYNTDHPAGGYSDGYLWNTKDNSFSLNKVKITFASAPAARSGEDWAAGYRVSLMAGEDAPILNSGSGITGFDYLREAYVDLNVPIGTGLNIKAGELISLLNFESGDGGAANPNFSQGYQWYYTGNGPSAGVQLDYAFTKWLDVKFRVDNGLYAGPVTTQTRKGVMGSIGITPDSKTWISIVGFGGEGAGSLTVNGASVLGGRQFTDKLGTGFEFDYFHFEPDGASSGDTWSIGGWVWYDFTSKFGVAFRGEYLDDKDGMGINTKFGGPAPFGAGIYSNDLNGNLASFTFTVNLKPAPNIKIQPEVRYDTTSYTGGLNGSHDQFILGCGASYLF